MIINWLINWYNQYYNSKLKQERTLCKKNNSDNDWSILKNKAHSIDKFIIDDKVKHNLKDYVNKIIEVEKTKESWNLNKLDEFNFLDWAMQEYKKSCCFDWGYDYGIKMETLDNPGWCIMVHLKKINIQVKDIKYEFFNDELDWLTCKYENDVFKGYGDPQKLKIIISVFRNLIEKKELPSDKYDIFDWLTNWYSSKCNGEWEHSYGIKIGTLDNPGCYVEINLNETNAENKFFNNYSSEVDKDDWILCKVVNKTYIGAGDLNKLTKIVEIFKNWVEH